MAEKFQDLTETEQILFRVMKKVQTDRIEHMKEEAFSGGSKQKEHRLKKAACMNKENVLEQVLLEAGLYRLYNQWAWKK